MIPVVKGYPGLWEMDSKLQNYTSVYSSRSVPSASRSEKILDGLQTTLNHDLPNLVIAMQGLLQIVELEEAANFSTEGKDFFRRLQSTVHQMRQTLTLIRSVNKTTPLSESPTNFSLRETLIEAAAVVKLRFPEISITFEGQAVNGFVPGFPDRMQTIFAEILTLMVTTGSRSKLICSVSSRKLPNTIELLLDNHPNLKTEFPSQSSPKSEWNLEVLGQENRLRLLLLDTLVSSTNSQLQIQIGKFGKRFELSLPREQTDA